MLIEQLLHNKPFMSINSFNSLSHPFILCMKKLSLGDKLSLTSHSQKMAEPEFKLKPYLVILRSTAIIVTPVIVISCSAEPLAPQNPP